MAMLLTRYISSLVDGCSINGRKYFFALKVVEPWNNLPSGIIDFSSLYKFKRSLLKINLENYLTYDVNK